MSRLNCTYFLSNLFDPDIFVIVGILLLAAVSYFVLRRSGHVLSSIGLGLVWAGGLHNMYLRLVYNCVRDNLNFFGLFMFNLADLYVVIGSLLILLGYIKYGKKDLNN